MRTVLFIDKCLVCGVTFNVTTKRPEQKFCSQQCARAKQKTGKLFSCTACGTLVYKPLSRIRGTVFCSFQCSNGSRLKIGSCRNCSKPISGKTKKYCSLKCQGIITKLRTESLILSGQFMGARETIKTYLIKIRGHHCEKCKLTIWNEAKIPIEINHIDGNSDNNKLENVELLCSNCHAQTPTYKGKNRGKGHYKRRERYRIGLSY